MLVHPQLLHVRNKISILAGAMVNHQFSDDRLAALYDRLFPWERRDDFAFYLKLIMSAKSVLDVGCGTGALLRRAPEAGHPGTRCGLRPPVRLINPPPLR